MEEKSIVPATEELPSIKKIETVVSKMASGEITPEECCERAGITLDSVYASLSNLMKAEMPVKTRYDFEMFPDNRVRLAAVQLVLELRKHIKDKSVVNQVAIFNDTKVEAEAQRILAMRGGLRE